METLEQAKEVTLFANDHIKKCSTDIFYWINHHVQISDFRDPSASNKNFVPYDFQKDLMLSIINSIDNDEDLIIEKTRDIGATWSILIVFVWYWLFRSCHGFLVGAAMKKMVSATGNIDSLFEKVLFILNNQPEQILPESFRHNYKKHYKYGCLKNPFNQSVITFACANSGFECIGKYTAIFYDEMAKWKKASQCWANGADSTNIRIALSTPIPDTKRKKNKFNELIHDSKLKLLSINIENVEFKDEKWLEKQKIRRSEDEFQALDINSHRSEDEMQSINAKIKRLSPFIKNNSITTESIQENKPLPQVKTITEPQKNTPSIQNKTNNIDNPPPLSPEEKQMLIAFFDANNIDKNNITSPYANGIWDFFQVLVTPLFINNNDDLLEKVLNIPRKIDPNALKLTPKIYPIKPFGETMAPSPYHHKRDLTQKSFKWRKINYCLKIIPLVPEVTTA